MTGKSWALPGGILAACLTACAPAVHTTPAAHPLAALPDVAVDTLAPGVVHVAARDPRGPWQVHVIAIDRAACEPRLAVRKPAGRLSERMTTAGLGTGALAAVNADFFRTPGGTPVGAHVHEGVPLIGPSQWPAFVVTYAGDWYAGNVLMAGRAWTAGDSAAVVQVNRPALPFTAYSAPPDGLTLFTALADTVYADSAAAQLVLRRLHGDERRGSAVVARIDTLSTTLLTTADTLVVRARGGARTWLLRRAAGDTVAWHNIVRTRDGRDAAEVAGGFPLLLDGGRDVLGEQVVREEFGLQRHPRTAIGWTADARRLFLLVVDGRQTHSDGMTLPELVWLFRVLGAAHALNLDGGGSTTLVVRDVVVNRPSDAAGERAVGNALVLESCR